MRDIAYYGLIVACVGLAVLGVVAYVLKGTGDGD
jgi:branched-subunit amino acid permease